MMIECSKNSSSPKGSFKKRIMKKFLYDATLCALNRSFGNTELPIPEKMLLINDDYDDNFVENNPIGVSAIGDESIGIGIKGKGLFANLKRAKTVRKKTGKYNRMRDKVKQLFKIPFTEALLFTESTKSSHPESVFEEASRYGHPIMDNQDSENKFISDAKILSTKTVNNGTSILITKKSFDSDDKGDDISLHLEVDSIGGYNNIVLPRMNFDL